MIYILFLFFLKPEISSKHSSPSEHTDYMLFVRVLCICLFFLKIFLVITGQDLDKTLHSFGNLESSEKFLNLGRRVFAFTRRLAIMSVYFIAVPKSISKLLPCIQLSQHPIFTSFKQ